MWMPDLAIDPVVELIKKVRPYYWQKKLLQAKETSLRATCDEQVQFKQSDIKLAQDNNLAENPVGITSMRLFHAAQLANYTYEGFTVEYCPSTIYIELKLGMIVYKAEISNDSQQKYVSSLFLKSAYDYNEQVELKLSDLGWQRLKDTANHKKYASEVNKFFTNSCEFYSRLLPTSLTSWSALIAEQGDTYNMRLSFDDYIFEGELSSGPKAEFCLKEQGGGLTCRVSVADAANLYRLCHSAEDNNLWLQIESYLLESYLPNANPDEYEQGGEVKLSGADETTKIEEP